MGQRVSLDPYKSAVLKFIGLWFLAYSLSMAQEKFYLMTSDRQLYQADKNWVVTEGQFCNSEIISHIANDLDLPLPIKYSSAELKELFGQSPFTEVNHFSIGTQTFPVHDVKTGLIPWSGHEKIFKKNGLTWRLVRERAGGPIVFAKGKVVPGYDDLEELASRYCEERGARLPTPEEFLELAEGMMVPTKLRASGKVFSGHLINDFGEKISLHGMKFWTSASSQEFIDAILIFDGSVGSVYAGVSRVPQALICVSLK